MKIVEIPFDWIYTQGKNTIVAIIDTHCDISHKDISKSINKYSTCMRAREYGKEHCTHIAGIILKVAPLCKLNIYQVIFVKSVGTAKGISNAINNAVDDGVDVINLSISLSQDFTCVRDSIKRAFENNIIVVGAVSNDGKTYYPANYKEVLSVTSFNDKSKADIYTEEKIVSTLPNNRYGELTGHSMSCAMVSGIVALARSYDKTMNRGKFISLLKRKTPDI
ncbi:MAG: S8 family serine peptidase [Melioribacteraceae bacterium]|nr:S8 family serine peptidase [Melioribacteraceae bacterium]